MYEVSDSSQRFLVRLYNSRWWSLEDVEGELEVLGYLDGRGIRVAAPVRRKDGGWVTTVQAPEGTRLLVVYRYLEGEALVPSRDARPFGQLVGHMHLELEGFAPKHRRPELTFEALMRDSFEVVITLLSENNDNRRYLESLRLRVQTQAAELELSTFRSGFCHGDLNFSNALRLADGEIALYDFAGCGPGLLAYDLAVFRWTQQAVGAPDHTWRDFVEGYRAVCELPERELAAMDLLVLLRQAYMLGHDARRTQSGSLGTRWRRVLRTPKVDWLRQLDAQLFGTEVEQRW